jgi:hypothetical protein
MTLGVLGRIMVGVPTEEDLVPRRVIQIIRRPEGVIADLPPEEVKDKDADQPWFGLYQQYLSEAREEQSEEERAEEEAAMQRFLDYRNYDGEL